MPQVPVPMAALKKMETKQKTSRTPHSRLFHVILKFLDHFCRDSANERVVWNVLGDDGTGSYYHIVANTRYAVCAADGG